MLVYDFKKGRKEVFKFRGRQDKRTETLIGKRIHKTNTSKKEREEKRREEKRSESKQCVCVLTPKEDPFPQKETKKSKKVHHHISLSRTFIYHQLL
jgi:hypothetical protein